MAEESSPPVPPAEESIEAEPQSGEPTPEPTGEPGFVCDCEESMRSACKGLPFYKEHESKRYCVLHYPGKEKSAEFKAALDCKLKRKDFDFRGVWFPDEADFIDFEFSSTADFSDALFSADANFGSATFSAAADFSNTTFSADAQFRSATFSAEADFSNTTFSADAQFRSATFSADAYFRSATFSAVANFRYATFKAAANLTYARFEFADFSFAKFKDTNFHRARFKAPASFRQATFGAAAKFSAMFKKDVFFVSAKFKDTDFSDATFRAAADFSSAKFKDAYFISATFTGAADFNAATFSGNVSFRSAILVFNDSVKFGPADERSLDDGTRAKERRLGNEPSLDFQYARIETPGTAFFHSVRLRPHWFVNIDSREFVFTDVEWELKRIKIKKEIAALETKRVSSPNRLLAIACRQLAENAEANGRYGEASDFRYWTMELQRQEMARYKFAVWRLDWWYWATSGYGERIVQAFLVLLAIWLVFVWPYTKVGFTRTENNSEVKLRHPTPAIVKPVEGDGSEQGTPADEATNPNKIQWKPDEVGKPLPFKRALTYSLEVMSLQKPEPLPLTNWAHVLVTLETVLGPVQAALLLLAIRRKFMR